MRKILAVIILLMFNNLIYASSGDTTVIEITDATLPTIYYHQTNFTTPTKLVFTNLTTVNGYVYFHQDVNLVEVDFPLLKNCDGNFYFNENTSLQKISAPFLNTVRDYLYVAGNTSLTQLDVCNLTQILPSASNPDPSSIYYVVSGNTASVDKTPLCFSKGAPANLNLSNNSINENQPVNSFVGKLSADGGVNDKLTYYLPNFTADNGQFIVRNDSLLSATTFNYQAKNIYSIKVGVRNLLGEKTEQNFSININSSPVTDTTVIEITDVTLPSVYYHQSNFTTPTKLVFTNLTTVNGYVYFHQNVNLVEVDFPLLKSCDGVFYFNQNLSLKKIVAPVLNTIQDYLYVAGNTSLTQLDVCGLTRILPSATNPDPSSVYYTVSNNTASVDKTPLCFSNGAPANLNLSNNSINENQPVKSFIGKLSADAGVNDKLTYYLSNNISDNSQFIIRNDSLLSATALDYEAKNIYNITIGVINQMGEKTGKNFSINIKDIVVEDTVVIEISDATMASVYYHQRSFTTPTKLVFKNLTRVTGFVYFHQNTNLAAVDFPLLDSTGGYFYFHENSSLQKISAPVLNTVTDYLYVYGHTLLTELNICNLTRILPSDATIDPYYYISNNKSFDCSASCLPITNVIFVPVKSLVVKPAPNTFIGYFISDAAITDSIRYYFAGSDGNEITNPDLVIRGDSVFLAREYASYTSTNFTFDVNAVRFERSQKRTIGLVQSLKEKIFLKVNTDLSNNIHFVNNWIGSGKTPATSAWENPANWSLNNVPDANTDAVIGSGNVIVATNAICRSLTVKTGANIIVKTGFLLNVTH
ncbi:MAG: cadherin repeat domain-containing protein [Ferruginibacter sp.]